MPAAQDRKSASLVDMMSLRFTSLWLLIIILYYSNSFTVEPQIF
jgi:hypothetical protein